MPIVGILANSVFIGAINTSASSSLTHNFGSSMIWAHPSLQYHYVDEEEGKADVYVSRFVDNTGVHNVKSTGVFVAGCTSVTYRIDVRDSFSRGLCITEFLA